jgi:hypothetical protein
MALVASVLSWRLRDATLWAVGHGSGKVNLTVEPSVGELVPNARSSAGNLRNGVFQGKFVFPHGLAVKPVARLAVGEHTEPKCLTRGQGGKCRDLNNCE